MLSVRQSVFVVPAVAEVARRRGLFAAAELDVSTATVPSSTAQRHDLDAGVADLAITATETENFPVMCALRDVELTKADMAFVNG